jgi:hypothetical protein
MRVNGLECVTFSVYQLVAKGFDQVDVLDFIETFSPVIKPATVRLILAVVVHYNWPIR